MSARNQSFRVVIGGGEPQPKPDPFTPAHGLAIAYVAAGIMWLGIGAAVLAWWDRP